MRLKLSVTSSPDQIEAHKASGVELFIHVRADALEVLTLLAQRLGVPV